MSVISVSMPKEELKKFDALRKKLGFSSRSDAIREALQRFTVQHRWTHSTTSSDEEPFIATLVYPIKREDPVHDVIHEFDRLIVTATHTHIPGGKCVEWIILNGSNQEIMDFVKRFSAIKDVRVCRCSV